MSLSSLKGVPGSCSSAGSAWTLGGVGLEVLDLDIGGSGLGSRSVEVVSGEGEGGSLRLEFVGWNATKFSLGLSCTGATVDLRSQAPHCVSD